MCTFARSDHHPNSTFLLSKQRVKISTSRRFQDLLELLNHTVHHVAWNGVHILLDKAGLRIDDLHALANISPEVPGRGHPECLSDLVVPADPEGGAFITILTIQLIYTIQFI